MNAAPDRRLGADLFLAAPASAEPAAVDPSPPAISVAGATPSARVEPGAGSAAGTLRELLKDEPAGTRQARRLPGRAWLLARGTAIDCTLGTALDSTLPGVTTCITATDTYSADGSTVLLERGTQLIGETRGQVQQGAARVFVLWTEARTPTGLFVPLDSPGTDALGRAGFDGQVERHFWQRFGAAFLISAIDGATQAAINASNRSGTTIVENPGIQNLTTEALQSTVNIAPTVTKAQGARIQVLVARDVDFQTVLPPIGAAAAAPTG
jgi:type IV secretion system protein VirB10